MGFRRRSGTRSQPLPQRPPSCGRSPCWPCSFQTWSFLSSGAGRKTALPGWCVPSFDALAGWRSDSKLGDTGFVNGSEHRVVVRRCFRDRLDDIPVLDHLALFPPEDIDDGFAARTVRQAAPVAVEDDVITVREDALDLAMRVRMIGQNPGDELAYALHAVLDEGIMLAIPAAGIDSERVLNVAFKERLLVEGDGIGFVRFRHGRSFQGAAASSRSRPRDGQSGPPRCRVRNGRRRGHGF